MSNTKDILIKLKDATINQAVPLNDLPVEDIKEAIKAEYSISFGENSSEYDNLTQYCNRTAATFTSISDAITFLDTMINYSASADNISSNDIELPDNINPDEQYLTYLNLAEHYKNNNINLKDLFHFALTKWKIFAVLAVFFVAAAAIYSYLLATPLYDSAGKIYIINKETLTSAEISASTYLTRDYTNLIADAAVLSDVSDKLGKKYSVSELKNAITVNNPENTRFIEISVRTASANDSKVIVDTVCTVAQEKITELLGVDRVTIIRKGTVAASPSVPNKTKNIMVAFLLSCFTYAAIVFVSFYFNDKIEDSADVEKCLGLTVLGNIPCNSTRRRSK